MDTQPNDREATLACSSGDAASERESKEARYHGCVVSLLPYLERRDLYARCDFEQPSIGTANEAIGQIRLEILVCPDDDSSHSSEADLSYVVNCGIGFTMRVDVPSVYRSPSSPSPGAESIDLNGIIAVTPGAPDGRPTDRDLFGTLGLFIVENWPHGTGSPPRRRSLDSAPDGLSQTIMFAENARAGGFDQAPGANWATPDPWRNAFFLSGYICDSASCAPGAVHYDRANQAGGGPWSFESINAGLSQAEGKAPWPSSGHLGGVQVLFADGHLTFMAVEAGALDETLWYSADWRWEGRNADRSDIAAVARFSAEINVALARLVSCQPLDAGRLARGFLRLGPAGWHRYLRDSRIIERCASRLLAGGVVWSRTTRAESSLMTRRSFRGVVEPVAPDRTESQRHRVASSPVA